MDSDRGQSWSFNQPVLLNKTRRNSTVLVWTLVASTAVATAWAVLAPLPRATTGPAAPEEAAAGRRSRSTRGAGRRGTSAGRRRRRGQP